MKNILIALSIILLTSCASPISTINNNDYKDQDIDYIPSSFDDAWLWVSSNIKYESNEYKKTPEQTYNDRSGDCEDSAILLAYFGYVLNEDVYVSVSNDHVINYHNGEYITPQVYNMRYADFDEIERYTYKEAFSTDDFR